MTRTKGTVTGEFLHAIVTSGLNTRAALKGMCSPVTSHRHTFPNYVLVKYLPLMHIGGVPVDSAAPLSLVMASGALQAIPIAVRENEVINKIAYPLSALFSLSVFYNTYIFLIIYLFCGI